jgi:phospholipase C
MKMRSGLGDFRMDTVNLTMPANMAIIIAYDENGGFWDHVPPPKGDRWGPGTRIPAIRFDLEPLPGVRAGMGNLTNAFSF